MSEDKAGREARYAVLFHESCSLTKEIDAFEDFLDKLRGTPRPTTSPGIKQGQTSPVFSEVYGNLASDLRQIRERLSKVRSELEELLV